MTPVPGWAIQAIIHAGQRMDARGWVPATAGNISVRLADGSLAITRSGTHKGFLKPDDVMTVDPVGRSVSPDARPSAETGLHCQIYRMVSNVGAVLHGHSIAGTVLSMALEGVSITFAGYELLKAFEGQTTHDASLSLPVFDNDQNIPRLMAQAEPHLAACKLGYLIRGHGAYVWAPDMDTALARLEGLEFLLACELERRKLR